MYYSKSQNILITVQTDHSFCSDCIKFDSFLEGLDYAFLKGETLSIFLIDETYMVDKKLIDAYLNIFPERNLTFSDSFVSQRKRILFSGQMTNINPIENENFTLKKTIIEFTNEIK